jgi:hypothetical protein
MPLADRQPDSYLLSGDKKPGIPPNRRMKTPFILLKVVTTLLTANPTAKEPAR